MAGPEPSSDLAELEKAGEWYEQDYTSPFMILVYKTRIDKREKVRR